MLLSEEVYNYTVSRILKSIPVVGLYIFAIIHSVPNEKNGFSTRVFDLRIFFPNFCRMEWRKTSDDDLVSQIQSIDYFSCLLKYIQQIETKMPDQDKSMMQKTKETLGLGDTQVNKDQAGVDRSGVQKAKDSVGIDVSDAQKAKDQAGVDRSALQKAKDAM